MASPRPRKSLDPGNAITVTARSILLPKPAGSGFQAESLKNMGDEAQSPHKSSRAAACPTILDLGGMASSPQAQASDDRLAEPPASSCSASSSQPSKDVWSKSAPEEQAIPRAASRSTQTFDGDIDTNCFPLSCLHISGRSSNATCKSTTLTRCLSTFIFYSSIESGSREARPYHTCHKLLAGSIMCTHTFYQVCILARPRKGYSLLVGRSYNKQSS